jgi:uncharacterized protein YndB with AHSA1/START domain
MTTHDVPLRSELTFEVPGTAAQVWDAIATADGITAWFLPTDLEEREGGVVVFHMGEESSGGTVTGWDPLRRFAIVEPAWATLSGHDVDSVTPLATEFLVEARSGGTCVVRVVSSAFGTGADWEGEFFEEMERMWPPYFERLRLYLTHYAGQRVTLMEATVEFPGEPGPVSSAMRQALGVEAVGQRIDVRGHRALVEAIDDVQLLVRLLEPIPGYLAFSAYWTGQQTSSAAVQGHLFSPDAPALVEREQPEWQAWLESLAVAVGVDGGRDGT